MTEQQMARLTVDRTSPHDVRHRQIIVSVDGESIGTLLFGESVTWEVAPGPHRLRVHNTLVWKTLDLDVAEGEHARFLAVNRAGFGTVALVSLLGAGPLYVTLERV
jgi:hypothetical protein